ncbi:type II secretion system F family protein [Anaerosolibacter sp.]|uniref:type II secretion system F family protein n=1 Tax=Anaerosolibacter sp. TaxID=1872527 RepID=UPI0039EDEC92
MMLWIIVILFQLTSLLFFIGLFNTFFVSSNRLDKRMQLYLSSQDENPLDRKRFNLLVQIQMYNQHLRKGLSLGKNNTRLSQRLHQAGVPLKSEEFTLFQLMSTFLLGGLLFIFSGKVFFFIVGGILGYLYPHLWLNQKQRKRIMKFNDGLPDMITIIVGSLRAGFSFPQSLKSVVEESDAPVREEIDMVLREMQYGASIEDALHHLHERMPSGDLDLMIQAILIQRQVGGNLATVLDTIVQTIRDRNAIQRQVMTLTAQGRLSGTVIGLLPIVLGLVLYFINPEYIGTLFKHPVGMGMMGAGIVSGTIGFILIRKLTSIEV